ncbi:MAG: polysaccharide deacetylase family protein [Rubrobacteraceae bacterium]
MEISLTFDDGPDPVGTPRVLAALKGARATATFFVVTPLANRYPALISDILKGGNRIEFHCAEHIRHTDRSRKEVEEDTRTGLRDLNTLGITPGLWRTPWGDTADWTEEIARRFGLELVAWTVDTHDWRGDPAADMLEAVTPLLNPGGVVLMHDGLGPGARRTDCGETAALIPPLTERIRALGCEPAPVKPARNAAPA